MLRILPLILIILILQLFGCGGKLIISEFPESTERCWCYPRSDPANTGFIDGELQLPISILWKVDLKVLDPTSPVISGNKVIVGLRTKRVLAYNHETGEKDADVWLDVPLLYPPAIDYRKLWFFGFGGWNRAGIYDLNAGKKIWSRSTGDSEIFGLPCDSILIIGTLSGGIYGLSDLDGEKKWQIRRNSAIKTSMARITDTIFAASGKEILSFSCDGEIFWRTTLEKNPTGVLTVSDGRIFCPGSDGSIFALSSENGNLLWQRVISSESALPVATDGKTVVAIVKEGKIFGLDIESGEIKWQNNTGAINSSPPVIVGNHVICATYSGTVLIFECQSGDAIESFELNEPVRQPPVSDGRMIYISTASGKLFCLQ